MRQGGDFHTYIKDVQILRNSSNRVCQSAKPRVPKPKEASIRQTLMEDYPLKLPSIKKHSVIRTEQQNKRLEGRHAGNSIQTIRLVFLPAEFKKRARVKYHDPEKYIKGIKPKARYL